MRQPIQLPLASQPRPYVPSATIRDADDIANPIAQTLAARRWLRVPGRCERSSYVREPPYTVRSSRF